MDSLDILRQKFMMMHNSILKQSTLLSQREGLHSEIEKLEDHLTANQYLVDEQQLAEHDKIKQSAQLKQQLLEVDHALDELESILQTDEEALKEQIAEELLKNYPEEQSFYGNLKDEIASGKIQTSKIERWIHLCQQLIQILEAAQSARLTIRQRGILSYIFGGNPTVIISQHLQAAALLIAKAETQLASEEFFKPVIKEFSLFLKGLRKECEERWGFNKIDTTIGQAVQILGHFKVKFESMLVENNKQAIVAEEKLKAWLLER